MTDQTTSMLGVTVITDGSMRCRFAAFRNYLRDRSDHIPVPVAVVMEEGGSGVVLGNKPKTVILGGLLRSIVQSCMIYTRPVSIDPSPLEGTPRSSSEDDPLIDEWSHRLEGSKLSNRDDQRTSTANPDGLHTGPTKCPCSRMWRLSRATASANSPRGGA